MTDYTNLPDEQLDRLVAEKAMGWKIDNKDDPAFPLIRKSNDMTDWIELAGWQPTTNIQQAMMVVDKMIERDYQEVVMVWESGGWIVELYKHQQSYDGGEARDKSLPMAICLAALKAVE